jgi:methionyl-tRNA formyltransferase
MAKTLKTTQSSGNKLVFFGSGPVAAEALEKLTKNFQIEAVITKPKPPHHRGNFPVLDVAKKLELKTLLVTDKKSLSELFETKPVTSPIGVVIDFGIIISQDVIDYFPLGIVNSHFSLLPRWRGADPISFAILEGDLKTGVSLMVIEAGLDTGKLITQKVMKIEDDDTTASLTKKLIGLSDELLKNYLPKYIMGDIKPHNQPHPDRVTHSRKLTKNDGVINWGNSAAQIEREIRAFADWPKSRTNLADIEVIITKAHVDKTAKPQEDCQPGKAWIENKQIKVQARDLPLIIDRLKPTGKAEMTAEAFLNGYKIN